MSKLRRVATVIATVVGFGVGSAVAAQPWVAAQGTADGCDPFDDSACVLPFPNDYFTEPDANTDTGRRIAFASSALPANALGVHIDPTEWNRNDGFSPGSPVLTAVPGLDLEQTGAAPITDIGASLADDAPIVLLNARTGERHPYWAELDSRATDPDRTLLIVRPARNFDEGERYIVALRNFHDVEGETIEPPDVFSSYVKGRPPRIPARDPRFKHTKRLLAELQREGIHRGDLYLAWDFTVASERNLSERALTMRDTAFDTLGDDAPDFTVTSIEDEPFGPDSPVGRVVRGTIDAPSFLTGSGGPGSRLKYGQDGLPMVTGTQSTDVVCTLPRRAFDESVMPVVYGHGLLGSPNEVTAGNIREMTDLSFGYCATQWIGMATEDIPVVAALLQDFSVFPALPDRLQQSFVQHLYLGRAMIHPDGLISDPAFQNAEGDPLLNIDAGLAFDGNSQGGIAGGALTALSQDFTNAVLGVPGMNYSTLLDRALPFEAFRPLFEPSYPDALDRQVVLGVAQMLWDRGEANGYAQHMTDDPFEATPAHRVLMHVAYGDFQVAPVSAEVEARTIGAGLRAPAVADGRQLDVEPYWKIEPIASYPHAGSALVIWDFGNPTPPLGNLNPFPPDFGSDPHGLPRAQSAAQEQKAVFMRIGEVVDTCGEGVVCPPGG
jgi:hypothetical protein